MTLISRQRPNGLLPFKLYFKCPSLFFLFQFRKLVPISYNEEHWKIRGDPQGYSDFQFKIELIVQCDIVL